MTKYKVLHRLIPAYIVVLGLFLSSVFLFSNSVSVMSENLSIALQRYVLIDAGHGGVDPGALTVGGIKESNINLEIALRLNDLFHLLGIQTRMIRSTDISVYTKGNTIAEKKISDLHERVRQANDDSVSLLVSIHMNYFSDSRYSGAQVFYSKTDGSREVAQRLQNAFVSTINTGSNRKSKPSAGVYLMDKVQCTAVLVECGFLSNPEEEYKLRSKGYQQSVCCVLAATVSDFLSNT